MLIDSQSIFSEAQAVTSTAISTNVIDLNPNASSNTTKDISIQDEIYLVVSTNTTCTDTGSDATLAVTLESDTAAGLSSSPTVHYTTGTLAFAAYATAGTTLVAVQLPRGTYKRYLGVRYTVASGPLTAGAFDAYLTNEPPKNIAYASGFAVS